MKHGTQDKKVCGNRHCAQRGFSLRTSTLFHKHEFPLGRHTTSIFLDGMSLCHSCYCAASKHVKSATDCPQATEAAATPLIALLDDKRVQEYWKADERIGLMNGMHDQDGPQTARDILPVQIMTWGEFCDSPSHSHPTLPHAHRRGGQAVQ